MYTRIFSTTLAAMSFLLASCAETQSLTQKNLKSDVYTQMYANNKIDILWVADNSFSMTDRRAYIAANMSSFISTLTSRKAIDYQMAVTTTDYFTTQGNLVQNPSGLKVVKYGVSANPAADVASIINNISDSATSFWEQGLESAYAATLNNGSQFLRTGATYYIIMVTDSDDWSCDYVSDIRHCQGPEPEHNPNYVAFPLNRYSAYFRNLKLNEGAETNIFPIVGTNDSNCAVEALGTRYMSLQSSLGGIGLTGSICLGQLPTAFNNIAKTISDRGVKFQLSAANPKVNGMTVYVNKTMVAYSAVDGWIYDSGENAIYFTGNSIPSLGSVIEIVYTK